MQVYKVTGLTCNADEGFFRNFQDIKPSLAISYSACKDVVIHCRPETQGGPLYTVTGSLDGKTFEERFKVTRYAVWDSPTHI